MNMAGEISGQAVLLRVFVGESDKLGHLPLYEAIVKRARDTGLAGATVLKGVLGFGLAGGLATGDVPFDGYQTYGTRNNLRGYPGGKYRGKYMVAIQSEYRYNIYNRWGAVAFAGTGSVWGNEENGEESFEQDWLPSIGLGARYMVSLEKRINIRLDYAVGVDGNQGLYFGIMEAF